MKKLTKIQKSAKGELCTALLDGCRWEDTTTTVLAHNTESVPNSPRKCDLRAVYCCDNCHDRLDDRAPYFWVAYEKKAVWGRAIALTHVKLMEKGLITVVGVEFQPSKQLPRRNSAAGYNF